MQGINSLRRTSRKWNLVYNGSKSTYECMFSKCTLSVFHNLLYTAATLQFCHLSFQVPPLSLHSLMLASLEMSVELWMSLWAGHWVVEKVLISTSSTLPCTNAPQTPYGGLLNITTASVTQHELTGFMTGYEYIITVCGGICGGLVGRESEPLTIIPQGKYN